MQSTVQALYCPLGTVTHFPDSDLWSLGHCDQLDFRSIHYASSVDDLTCPPFFKHSVIALNESVEVSEQDNERDDKGWLQGVFSN